MLEPAYKMKEEEEKKTSWSSTRTAVYKRAQKQNIRKPLKTERKNLKHKEFKKLLYKKDQKKSQKANMLIFLGSW